MEAPELLPELLPDEPEPDDPEEVELALLAEPEREPEAEADEDELGAAEDVEGMIDLMPFEMDEVVTQLEVLGVE